MQTIRIFFSFIFPIFSEECCGGRPERKTAERDANRHYRAVEGEMFLMPCIESVSSHNNTVCSAAGEGAEGRSFHCGTKFSVEAKHSGKYTCSGSKLSFHLQVVKRSESSLGCFLSEENSVELLIKKGGTVPCPGHTCSNNTDTIWYKDHKAVSEQNRKSCQTWNGALYLCRVFALDTGVYFCDRQILEQGVNWTFRRAVNVTVIHNVSDPPTILYPGGNAIQDVELGLPHTLECRVRFTFETKSSREVLWYMWNYGCKTENMTLLPTEEEFRQFPETSECEVFGRVHIEQVTRQHLNQRYTCIARNIIGNSSATIQLKEKTRVKWSSLVEYPVASLLFVAGLGIVLRVKWLEIQLLCRSYFKHRKQDGDEKEFDVFLSCVWSPSPAEVEGILTNSDEDACLTGVDPLTTREGVCTQRPLEVVLPRVIEEQWGYRLCLLERDVAPGGAFTNDVVLAIQRSRMLICLLSADYLSNSNAVFVLESGIQALLQNSALKLLPIWTGRASASLVQPDSPLPTLVQRALKVLPSLDWTSAQPSTSGFWRSLRKAMPDQRVKLDSLAPNQLILT
uniref:Interleukin 18 receptor accessory protein n=1 Tax=Gasterosteus aculeatus aculeatus TaxID=481459 RepID=A0AAQ4QBZ0_GASAC|nr:interleukin-18 receptor accessory protein-like [Gasterosteus aculeatus aculeatus]